MRPAETFYFRNLRAVDLNEKLVPLSGSQPAVNLHKIILGRCQLTVFRQRLPQTALVVGTIFLGHLVNVYISLNRLQVYVLNGFTNSIFLHNDLIIG